MLPTCCYVRSEGVRRRAPTFLISRLFPLRHVAEHVTRTHAILMSMLMGDASCDATPNGPAHGRLLSTVLHIVITTNQIRDGLNESSWAHRANTSTHINTRSLWLIVACGPCWEKVTSLLDPCLTLRRRAREDEGIEFVA